MPHYIKKIDGRTNKTDFVWQNEIFIVSLHPQFRNQLAKHCLPDRMLV